MWAWNNHLCDCCCDDSDSGTATGDTTAAESPINNGADMEMGFMGPHQAVEAEQATAADTLDNDGGDNEDGTEPHLFDMDDADGPTPMHGGDFKEEKSDDVYMKMGPGHLRGVDPHRSPPISAGFNWTRSSLMMPAEKDEDNVYVEPDVTRPRSHDRSSTEMDSSGVKENSLMD